MSIVALSEIAAFFEDELADDTDIQGILDGAEVFVGNYCKRTFEETSYREYHSGKGTAWLHLDNFPVTNVTRLAIGRCSAVRIYNTNTSSTATVSANSTGVMLTYNGTTDSTCTFASYTTLTTLVAAINALSANGWAAELTDTQYGAYLSTELVSCYGKSCIRSAQVYLDIPEVAEYDFELDEDAGIIEYPGKFPAGYRNILVQYTAGYTTTTMPEDLKLAVKIIVKDWYEKRSESSFNLSSYSVGGMSKHIEGYIPQEALRILNAYRRMMV